MVSNKIFHIHTHKSTNFVTRQPWITCKERDVKKTHTSTLNIWRYWHFLYEFDSFYIQLDLQKFVALWFVCFLSSLPSTAWFKNEIAVYCYNLQPLVWYGQTQKKIPSRDFCFKKKSIVFRFFYKSLMKIVCVCHFLNIANT